MQAYTAYYRSGSIVFDDNISVPEGSRAIVTFLDDKLIDSETAQHRAAWNEFFEAISSSDEYIPETFERVTLSREIDL